MLHAGTRPQVVALGAGALALIALGSAWFGFSAAGFGGLGVAWLVGRCAAILARVHGEQALEQTRWFQPETAFSVLLDLGFAAIAAWRLAAAFPVANAVVVGGFIALVLLGLLRLLPRLFAGAEWSGWLEDRLVLALALAAASLTSVFGLTLMAAGLALLVFGLIAAHDAPNAPGDPVADGDGAG